MKLSWILDQLGTVPVLVVMSGIYSVARLPRYDEALPSHDL